MSTAVIDTCTLINLKNIKRIDLIDYLHYYLITTVYVVIEINRGSDSTKKFFRTLESTNKIQHIKLSIDDLIDMANIPKNKKRLSNPELSCFVKAKNLGCITFTDDKKAIKYLSQHLRIENVKGISDIIGEAYLENYIGDSEVIEFIRVLKENRFILPEDYYENLASKKLMKHIAVD